MAKDEENMVGSLVAIGEASKNLLQSQTCRQSLFRVTPVKISSVNGNRVAIGTPVEVIAPDKATARIRYMKEYALKLPEDDESGSWVISVFALNLGDTD